MTIGIYVLQLLANNASAQSLGPNFEVLDDDIVSENVFPTAVNGAGAPSVQWWDNQSVYVMAFETEVSVPLGANCPEGAWEIWFATASVVEGPWTLGTLKVGVNANQNRECGARSPAFAILDNGNWGLLYNALQDGSSDIEAGWATKIGSTLSAGLLPALDGLKDLTLLRYDNEWYAWGVDPDPLSATYDHLMWASSLNLTNSAAWSGVAEAMDPAILTGWGGDAIVSPSIICEDSVSAYWPWHWQSMGVESGDWAYGGAKGTLAMGWSSGSEYIWTSYLNSTFRNLEYMSEDNYTPPAEPIRITFYENVDPVSGLPKIGVAVDGYNGDWTMDTTNLLGRDCAP